MLPRQDVGLFKKRDELITWNHYRSRINNIKSFDVKNRIIESQILLDKNQKLIHDHVERNVDGKKKKKVIADENMRIAHNLTSILKGKDFHSKQRTHTMPRASESPSK